MSETRRMMMLLAENFQTWPEVVSAAIGGAVFIAALWIIFRASGD